MSEVVVLCHVALDERNGGGLRTLLGYLSSLPATSFTSVHLGDSDESGRHSLGRVNYIRLEKAPFPRSLVLYTRRLGVLKREVGGDPLFLLFPNTEDDVQLCLAATFVSRRTCVWLMDDFVSAAFPGDRLRRILLKWLFGFMYRSARRRIAVSAPMQREYARRYGHRADLVLGKRWRLADLHPGPRRAQPVGPDAPLRIVWVGKYQSYYHDPVAALSALIRDKLHLPVCIDLYGQLRPPPDVLIPGRIEYRGAFDDSGLLDILREYDFGALTYSFDPHTRTFMRYSFPGKLTDYVSVGLPVLTVSPRDISACDDVLKNDVGPCVFSLEPDTLEAGLRAAVSASSRQLEQWRSNSLAWARREFVYEEGLQSFRTIIG